MKAVSIENIDRALLEKQRRLLQSLEVATSPIVLTEYEKGLLSGLVSLTDFIADGMDGYEQPTKRENKA